MTAPKNIVFIIADSLRWDSVRGGDGPRTPYIRGHATDFVNARSAGCWTLPATASIFTGLLPHEHGADSQTRGLDEGIPTLAEAMQAAGYHTAQITANVATTSIFGLHRGFDEVVRIWEEVPAKHKKLHELVVLIGKPRLRKKIISTDWIRGTLSQDIEAAKVWLQDTVQDVFGFARQRLVQHDRNFLFLNLMESHFPYHSSEIFAPIGDSWPERIREVVGLYHTVNQTFMARGTQPIGDETMALLRRRQRLSWERLAPQLDAFVQELHAREDTLVVFASDHGDCFGENGWVYHFANVADGGNRVPLYWLAPGQTESAEITTPISTRDLYHALKAQVGLPYHHDIMREPEASQVILESCWYNAHGTTLPQYRYNQLAFVQGETRWMRRNGDWYTAPASTLEGEAAFVKADADPLEGLPEDARREMRRKVTDFEAFSSRILG